MEVYLRAGKLMADLLEHNQTRITIAYSKLKRLLFLLHD